MPGVDHGGHAPAIGALILNDDAGPAAQCVGSSRSGREGDGQVVPVDEVVAPLVTPLDELMDRCVGVVLVEDVQDVLAIRPRMDEQAVGIVEPAPGRSDVPQRSQRIRQRALTHLCAVDL